MHEKLKKAVGIDIANCSTCANLGSNDDGGEPEYSVSWPVCEKNTGATNLKGFPFKSEAKCWEPGFWHSKFTDLIKTGGHEEVMFAIKEFVKARDTVEA